MKPARCMFFYFVFICLLSVSAFSQKMNIEDVLSKHLNSIGTSENRASIKNLLAVGDVAVTFVSQKDVTMQGRIVLASEGNKNFWGINLNSGEYPQERFSFNGKSSKVAFVKAGNRSVLGNFISSYNVLMEEGLLGGTLSESWALFNLSTNKAKVSLDGTKKIDGKEAYVISYSPKGGSDVDIKLYFDKESFRHVRTEYKRISSAGIGKTPEESSQFNETRFKVVEDFSDFKDEKGLMLPHKYQLFYSVSGQRGTTEIKWVSDLTGFVFNQKLDAKTFEGEM